MIMGVSDQCFGSFLRDLDFGDSFPPSVPNQSLDNQSDQDLIQSLYSFANTSIYGKFGPDVLKLAFSCGYLWINFSIRGSKETKFC